MSPGAGSSLKGRVAVVTGGGGVLGSGMARCLARAGALVAVLGRTAARVEVTAEEIAAEGGEVLAVTADVLDRTTLETAHERIVERLGAPDVLVNAAGGNLAGATVAPDGSFFDLSIEAFDAVVDLNLKGTLLPTLVFARSMGERGRGVIVNVSSLAAARPLTRVVGYAAAKAGIENLTRWLAVEMAHKFGPGMRVNAIAPGFFLTEQNRTLLIESDGTFTERARAILAHTPAGRFGVPADLDSTLLWLCADASRFVTGVVVPVDGGFSAFAGV